MSKFFIVVGFLSISVSSAAFAEDSSIECANRAQSAAHGNYTQDQAVILCSGATSNAPIDCANRAQSAAHGNYTQDQAVILCKGAQ